ncbi:MAG TPA: hypothetical protein DCQ31_14745, partial [Bacteroidales bacterium]|nr:hypothetical protein [Bacteroidales bacterium]
VQLEASDTYPDQAMWEAVTVSDYVFSNMENPTSYVSNLTDGIHIFKRILSTECNDISDEVRIKKISKPDITLPNDTVIFAENLTINAIENENNGQWSVVQGDAGFSSLENPVCQLTDIAYGTNIFRRTVANQCGSNFKNITITRRKPAINLGNDQTVCGNETELHAFLEDTSLRGKWSVIKGTAIIHSADSTKTPVMLANGENIFRYTVFIENDTIFAEQTIFSIELPKANAGNDTTICQTMHTLNGKGNGEGKWYAIDGDVNIYNVLNSNSNIEVLSETERPIKLQYTVTNACGIATDEISIQPVLEKPNAGDDLSFCG